MNSKEYSSVKSQNLSPVHGRFLSEITNALQT